MGTFKGGVLLPTMLMTGFGASAIGGETRRPEESAGCDPNLMDRLLTVMEMEIIPLTREGVRQGNKVFGAAMLKKSDLSTIIAGTNHETENPLWHGEIYTINQYYEMVNADDSAILPLSLKHLIKSGQNRLQGRIGQAGGFGAVFRFDFKTRLTVQFRAHDSNAQTKRLPAQRIRRAENDHARYT